MVYYIDREPDDIAFHHLLDYLTKHPSGKFQDFFNRADPSTKEKIIRNRSMLTALAKEPDSKHYLLPMFEELSDTDDIETRRMMAQILAEFLDPVQYLSVMIKYICQEPDDSIKKNLLTYLDRVPGGEFYKFFTNADTKTQSKIKGSREMLLRLANEPVDDKDSENMQTH